MRTHLVPLCCALLLVSAPALLAQKSAAPPKPSRPLVLGQFKVANPGGSTSADFRDPKKPVFTLRGPKLTLRSASLDLDARQVRVEMSGRLVSVANAEGPLRIVLRQAGRTETLTCLKAVYRLGEEGKDGQIDLTGDVHWIHTGEEVEGPAELTGDSGRVILRGSRGEGPLIELSGGGLVATPKEPPAKEKAKP